jgi:steroid delta-isomerase-like uncharacterized protein
VKHAVGLLGLVLLSACTRQEPAPAIAVPAAKPAAAPATPAVSAQVAMPSDERVVMDAYLAAINDHDMAKAGMMLDEHVHYFDAFSGQVQNTRMDAVNNVLDLYQKAVPDGHWEMRSEPASGRGTIAYEWTYTGTNLGSWGGIGASGQKINLKGVSFVRVANGKIVYKADYFDTATLGKQLGWQ